MIESQNCLLDLPVRSKAMCDLSEESFSKLSGVEPRFLWIKGE